MKCNKKTAVFSRIVGYYQPIQQWNKGKRDEFVDRVAFDDAIERGDDSEDTTRDR